MTSAMQNKKSDQAPLLRSYLKQNGSFPTQESLYLQSSARKTNTRRITTTVLMLRKWKPRKSWDILSLYQVRLWQSLCSYAPYCHNKPKINHSKTNGISSPSAASTSSYNWKISNKHIRQVKTFQYLGIYFQSTTVRNIKLIISHFGTEGYNALIKFTCSKDNNCTLAAVKLHKAKVIIF